jgi:RimJ/RimL family protein N-acetyltransferase
MTDVPFTFRPLLPADLPTLVEWIARPHVAEYWDSPTTLEEVTRDYAEDTDPARGRPFIASLGEVPIGFIQVYHVMSDDPDWWPDETDPGARGIDQFLIDGSQLGKGLGTRMITAFVERLFEDPAVTKVQVDPVPGNAQAIRAYEKVGFQRIGEVETPDGRALLMVVSQEAWASRARRSERR